MSRLDYLLERDQRVLIVTRAVIINHFSGQDELFRVTFVRLILRVMLRQIIVRQSRCGGLELQVLQVLAHASVGLRRRKTLDNGP